MKLHHNLFILIAGLVLCLISSIAIEGFQLELPTKYNKSNDQLSLENVTVQLVSRSIETVHQNLESCLQQHDNTHKQRYRCFKQSKPYTPIVLWHGMGDTAYGSVDIVRRALEKRFPGIQVYSIQIGTNAWEDEMGSYFINVNHQIEQACLSIINNSKIQAHGSFNAVGFSQGGQFMRGLIERCPLLSRGIKVKNFISLGGQHQGIFGLPKCLDKNLCNYLRFVLTTAAYEKSVQEHVVQAEYWHDPLKEEEYRSNNIFLADINNELRINETYKKNLQQLDQFVLVEFLQDDMVIPSASSVFGFYKPGQTLQIESMKESRIYLDDRIGLEALDKTNRLQVIQVPGKHLQFHISWFLDELASVYLNN